MENFLTFSVSLGLRSSKWLALLIVSRRRLSQRRLVEFWLRGSSYYFYGIGWWLPVHPLGSLGREPWFGAHWRRDQGVKRWVRHPWGDQTPSAWRRQKEVSQPARGLGFLFMRSSCSWGLNSLCWCWRRECRHTTRWFSANYCRIHGGPFLKPLPLASEPRWTWFSV